MAWIVVIAGIVAAVAVYQVVALVMPSIVMRIIDNLIEIFGHLVGWAWVIIVMGVLGAVIYAGAAAP